MQPNSWGVITEAIIVLLDNVSHPLPIPSSQISFIPFHDGGALFYPGIQRLWVLNTLASYIWLSLGKHSFKETLVSDIAENFSIDSETVSRDMTHLLEHFTSEGLFETDTPVNLQRPEPPPYFVPDGHRWSHKAYTDPAAQCVIQAYGYACEIKFANIHQLNRFQEIYHYFVVEQSHTIQQRIFITPSLVPGDGEQTFDVYLDEQRIRKNVSDEELYSIIHFIFFSGCSEQLSQHGYLMFHAAALQKGDKTVVFPANSGSGKSTLTAAMLTQGWRCITDELSVVSQESLSLSPFPIPLRIRSGSFVPLMDYYPALSALPIHQDLYQQPIRWIPTPAASLAPIAEQYPITIWMYPQYEKEATTILEPLDKATALDKITATGSSGRAMTLRDAKCMVKLVEQTPCYTLTYSDLKNAIEKIESV